MSESLAELQDKLGYHFRNPELLKEAMTHKSYAAEWNVKYDNQRLEFFGDAVVQIILTKHLFYRFPNLQEGDLTKIRAALVNEASLALFASSLQLGQYMRFGQGEIENHGCERVSTISDTFEALSAAIYIDGGYDEAEKFILTVFKNNIDDPLKLLCSQNPKGALQEFTQAEYAQTPHYQVLEVSGPPHDPNYEVAVLLGDEQLASGTAHNRKSAEQAAAEKALLILKKRKEEKNV